MSNDKTLLDGMAKEKQSLAEMLGMEDKGVSDNIDQLKAMAEQGNQSAINALSIKYLIGDGVPKDPMEALYWLERSTSRTAKLNMGMCYQEIKEYKLAEKYFLEATSEESVARHAYLSLVLLVAEPEYRNLEKADRYLKGAYAVSSNADEDKVLADLSGNIGRMMVQSNPEKAIFWLKKALGYREKAEDRRGLEKAYGEVIGETESLTELTAEALAYMEGKGEQVSLLSAAIMFGYYYRFCCDEKIYDAKKFFAWTVIAADKGYAPAQLQLGQEYLGEKYNEKNNMHLDMDLEASERYLALAESNPDITESVKKHCKSTREVLKYAKEDQKKQREKVLGKQEATEILAEMEKNGSTVLRIPDGYTHIGDQAFMDYYDRKPRIPYMKKITEIIIPDSVVRVNWNAFSGCCKATKITLSKNLEYLGEHAFNGSVMGLFWRDTKDKRTVEKLVIPGKTRVCKDALDGISRIKELIFEEGQKRIDFCMLDGDIQKCTVEYLYIPDSVTAVNEPFARMHTAVIKKVSAPKHLSSELAKLKEVKIKSVEYR